jgi:hypothetical protein
MIQLGGRMRYAAKGFGVVVPTMVMVLIAGCATPIDQQEDRYQTFSDALRACRQQQPSRHGQKYRLPPTNPRVAECLKRHGWGRDGSRLDAGGGA